MPAKKSSATLSTLHEKLKDAEFVSASFKQTGVSEPFLVTGTFERIENAYGKQRNGAFGGRTTIGIDSWYVVLSQLTTYSQPCEGAKDPKSWFVSEKNGGLYPAPSSYIQTSIAKYPLRELWLPITSWKFDVISKKAGGGEL